MVTELMKHPVYINKDTIKNIIIMISNKSIQ